MCSNHIKWAENLGLPDEVDGGGGVGDCDGDGDGADCAGAKFFRNSLPRIGCAPSRGCGELSGGMPYVGLREGLTPSVTYDQVLSAAETRQ